LTHNNSCCTWCCNWNSDRSSGKTASAQRRATKHTQRNVRIIRHTWYRYHHT